MTAPLHELTVETIDGRSQPLAEYAGKTLLIVNVASRCGLTPQYKALEALYRRYAERGLVVLGFPCNQFGGQEPGTHEEIQAFCETYDVSFPLFAKIEVNGEAQSPLYARLTAAESGPEPAGKIQWNFTKFLVAPDGQVAARFAPAVAPDSPELVAALERVLG